MREYLIRAGIIGQTSGTNRTFGQLGTDGISGAIDYSKNEEMKSQPKEHYNSTWTVKDIMVLYLTLTVWFSNTCFSSRQLKQ